MSWDEEYDIVCVGSGIGGLSAALTGAEVGGAKVLVLEKFEQLGGVSALSSGQLWPGPNHIAEAAGISDTEENALKYITHTSQGLSTPDLRDNYFARTREALRFFSDVIGIEMEVVKGLPDYYYPIVPGSAAEGRFIEVKPFPGSKLGDYASKVLSSPYGAGYSYTTSNEWVQMQIAGGEFIGSCLQRHVAVDERCAGAGMAAAQVR